MNDAKYREIVEAWEKTLPLPYVEGKLDTLVRALVDVGCDECARLRKVHDQGVRRLREVEAERDAANTTIRLERGVSKETVETLRARIADLEAALRDAPDHSDLDAAVFEANRLAGELERAHRRISDLEHR